MQKPPGQCPKNWAKNRLKFVGDGIPSGADQIKWADPPLTNQMWHSKFPGEFLHNKLQTLTGYSVSCLHLLNHGCCCL